MDQTRDDFLAGARLAADEHRRVGGCDDGDRAAAGVASPRLSQTRPAGKGASSGPVSLAGPDDMPEGVEDRGPQFVQIDRLGQIVVGAALHRRHA